MENLFILKAISIEEKTEEDLKKEWEVNKLLHGKITFDKYKELMMSWWQDKYKYSESDVAYFTDLEMAIHSAKANMCDVNEGGTYEYVAIVEVSTNRIYTNCYPLSVRVFKYNRDNDFYEPVETKDDKIELIHRKLDYR